MKRNRKENRKAFVGTTNWEFGHHILIHLLATSIQIKWNGDFFFMWRVIIELGCWECRWINLCVKIAALLHRKDLYESSHTSNNYYRPVRIHDTWLTHTHTHKYRNSHIDTKLWQFVESVEFPSIVFNQRSIIIIMGFMIMKNWSH